MKDKISELYKKGVKTSDIAMVLRKTPQRINQVLIELGLKQKTFDYSPKITAIIAESILAFNRDGLTVTEISKRVDLTTTGIRNFLKKRSISTNASKEDRSRPCVVCKLVFTPKHSDGVKKNKYKTCSVECRSKHASEYRTKYTKDDIDKVLELKKANTANDEICLATGVNINKIKEVIKENALFLDPKVAQKNAYEAKLKKNTRSMEEMRAYYGKIAVSEESLEKTKTILLERGFEYIDGFEGKSNPFKIKCLVCNNIRTTHRINNVVKNACMFCSGCKKTSKAEIEIGAWVNSLKIKAEKFKFEYRKDGGEIDVFVPLVKVGIEYCGLYWHNENSPTSRGVDYHFNKMKKANKEGIRLITIFEDEWLNKKDQIKGFLRSVLNKNEIRLFARKTDLREVPKKEASLFLEENHIQGSSQIESAFGLYYNEELVGIVTGNKHHRQGMKNQFILNRLAFKTNVSVAGGSSRLLKALIGYAKKNGYLKLVSWSDNRWSEGNVYEKLGFVLEETLGPDYSYVVGQKRISKQSCTKENLLKKGAIGNTEKEMALSLGYSRIWDCGKKRWTFAL